MGLPGGKAGRGMPGSCSGQAGAGAHHAPGCVRRMAIAGGMRFYSGLAEQISSAVNVSAAILAEFVVLFCVFFSQCKWK